MTKKSLLCSPRRAAYFFLTFLVFLVIASAIVLPFVIAGNIKEESSYNGEIAFLKWAEFAMTDGLYQSRPIMRGVSGYVYGFPLLIPPYNGTVSERIEGQHFPNFDFAAEHFRSESYHEFIQKSHLFLAPGGVVNQIFPFSQRLLYQDLLSEFYLMNFPPIFNASYDSFETKLAYDDLTREWKLLQAVSIYNSSFPDSVFWGLAGTEISFSDFLVEIKFFEMAEQSGMDFLLCIQSKNSNKIIPVVCSDDVEYLEAEGFLPFIVSAQTIEFRQGQNIVFELFVKAKKRWNNEILLPWGLCMSFLLLMGVFSFFLFVLLNAADRSRENYMDYHLAPQTPPFAMLIIGPKRGEDAWNSCGEELRVALERERCHFEAYQTPQIHPNTATYILGSVDMAVQMAFAVMREVLQKSEHTDVVTLFGEEGNFIITCAVHWCVTAEVFRNPTEEFVQYSGPDISYCTHLYLTEAVGNAVTLSYTAKDKISCVPPSDIYAIPYSTGHAAATPEIPYYVFEGRNEAMRKAFIFAQSFSKTAVPMRFGYSRIRESNEDINSPFAENELDDEDARHTEESHLNISNHFEEFFEARMPMNPARDKRNSQYRWAQFAMRPEPQDEGRIRTSGLFSSSDFDLSFKGIDDLFSSRYPRTPKIVSRNTHGYFSPDSPSLSNYTEECSHVVTVDSRSVPDWLYRALKKTYDRDALSTGDTGWPLISTIVYYFYFGYALLFQPLSPRERENISQCLARAFGVPPQGLYEYMAVHCAIEFYNAEHKKT